MSTSCCGRGRSNARRSEQPTTRPAREMPEGGAKAKARESRKRLPVTSHNFLREARQATKQRSVCAARFSRGSPNRTFQPRGGSKGAQPKHAVFDKEGKNSQQAAPATILASLARGEGAGQAQSSCANSLAARVAGALLAAFSRRRRLDFA